MSESVIMPSQRLKILYLYKILLERTDEEHLLNSQELCNALAEYGISAARKAIYDDIEALKLYGIDIVLRKGTQVGYYVASREFELPELKLLADAVTSARFLTERKSRSLLKKIESLASVHQASQLRRQVYVADRVKAMNEKIYLNVDTIHRAIAEKKQIAFRYFDYNIDKKKRYRSGERSCSPYALIWNDERYYLVAHYEKYPDKLTNFRVDRMEAVQLLDIPAVPTPEGFDLPDYLSSTFSMFSGDATQVKLRFSVKLINAVIDRFGKEIMLIPDGDEHFTVHVSVKPEPTFFGWLFQFGELASVVAPQEIKERYIAQLKAVLADETGENT